MSTTATSADYDAPPALLQEALAQAACGFALFDPNDQLRVANPWFEQAFNIRAADAPTWEAMIRNCYENRCGVLIETQDIDAWIAQVRTKYRQMPIRYFQSDLVDGRWVWVTETLQPNGWLSVVITDVSPLKATEWALLKARDEAVRVSMTDSLTDLYNRRFIMNHLGKMLIESQAARWPLSIAMLDIDHFKRINDSAGHDVGDTVIRHLAKQLRTHLRPIDAVGRIGGEEFLIVLTNTGAEGAVQALNRVRQHIADSIRAASLPLPGYTFSAGIATAAAGDSLDSLFHRADQALYQAKRHGRNRDWAVNSDSMPL